MSTERKRERERQGSGVKRSLVSRAETGGGLGKPRCLAVSVYGDEWPSLTTARGRRRPCPA